MLLCRPRRLAALAPAELRHAGAGAVHPAAGGLCKLCKALTGSSELHGAVGGVHPGGVLGQIPLLPAAHVALPGPLHLANLVPGVFLAVILDVPGVQLFQLVARPCRRVAQLREYGEEGVAAVPAAQPCAGAVAGGGFEIRVVLAHVIDCAAPVELPALPLGVAGSGSSVGGGLEELHAHLVGAGDLQFPGGLVDAGQNGAPCGHLDAVLVAGRVGDELHAVCKAVHGLLHGSLVVKGTGAHLGPCGVQGALKLACDGVGRGGGQVLPCARRLACTSVQKVIKGSTLLKRRRFKAVVVIDGVLPLHGLGGRLQKQLPDSGVALAAVLGQQLDHVAAQGFGLLVAPQLPVGRLGDGAGLGDPPGDVL